MAAINANIVVDTTNLTVTPTTTNLGVVVDPINLNVYSGAFAPAGGNQGELQYNDIGALKGVANTNVANGNITFTNLSNVKIDGGTNAYYLQTDGTGNLTWAAGGTPTGSGVPSGANTQIQLSDGSGAFDSGAGFTFDKSSNIFSTPGRAIFAGNVDSTGGIFNGDGYGLSNIASANIVGLAVPEIENGTSNVNIPVTDGNISMSVNSTVDVVLVKTTGIEVDGAVTASAITANTGDITATAGVFNGDGGGLSNIAAANVVGLTLSQIANGTSNVDIASVDGNIDYNVGGANVARMSTTGAANPGFLAVNGNITAENDIESIGGQFIGDGSQLTSINAVTAQTVTTNAQPNITSLGSLTSLTLNSENIALGNGASSFENAIAIGKNAEAPEDVPGTSQNIAIGQESYAPKQGISLGYLAGKFSTNQATNADFAVTIGQGSGWGNSRGANSIAIGQGTGINQGANSIAIGTSAGYALTTAGANSISIGAKAGVNDSHANTIILNASGGNLDSLATNGLYIKPISGGSALTTTPLVWNSSSGLVTQEDELRVTNLSADDWIVPTSNNTSNIGFSGQRFENGFINNLTITDSINANIAPTTAVSTTISHKIPIDINGTTYYICLDSSA